MTWNAFYGSIKDAAAAADAQITLHLMSAPVSAIREREVEKLVRFSQRNVA